MTSYDIEIFESKSSLISTWFEDFWNCWRSIIWNSTKMNFFTVLLLNYCKFAFSTKYCFQNLPQETWLVGHWFLRQNSWNSLLMFLPNYKTLSLYSGDQFLDSNYWAERSSLIVEVSFLALFLKELMEWPIWLSSELQWIYWTDAWPFLSFFDRCFRWRLENGFSFVSLYPSSNSFSSNSFSEESRSSSNLSSSY